MFRLTPLLTLHQANVHHRFMTKWHVDKFILYTCALALHIDNFEVDINDLQEDLRLNPSEMQKYFLELGCRISALTVAQREVMRLSSKEAGSHKIARLILPLDFPKVRTGRANKQR
jgi:DNA-directed RNA polymerase I subunit RPA49